METGTWAKDVKWGDLRACLERGGVGYPLALKTAVWAPQGQEQGDK